MPTEDDPPIPYQSQPPGKPGRHLGITVLVALIALGAVLFVIFFFVLLPRRRAGSGETPQIKSASNLRQIGQAIIIYCSDNNGAYPDSFRTIMLSEDVGSDVFVSPISSDTPAKGSGTAAADQLATGGHSSYIYLGNGLTTTNVTPDTVVAYEKLEPTFDGTNVLCGDGQVNWVDAASAAKIVAKAQAGNFPVTMPSN